MTCNVIAPSNPARGHCCCCSCCCSRSRCC
nr:MAG TPA: Protein of unknown function (DUF2477) [Caudoviricetes sp.]DAR80262.1 MAG TPA: Protein of unknown function (DUF2477) [Caudoviricetes sp.]